MKNLFTFLLILASTQIFAQPDLICSNVTCTQTSVDFGNKLICSFRIKNIGTQAAAASHATIYLVDSATQSSTRLADVSTQALAANTETNNYSFLIPLHYDAVVGQSNIVVVANKRGEVLESNYNNNYLYSSNTITITGNYGIQQNFTYPVILVHGLNDLDTTWYPFLRDNLNNYGYCYGGNMDFCLNQDGNIHTSNITNPNLPYDIKDWTDTTQLTKGDYYTINFNIDNNGIKYINSATSESNQSAILKQGIAMQKAIQHVLKVTGREKVILLGHSMGGLASREYLQNRINWQSDGKHHVAKLETIGTPHGGSNATSFGIQITPNLDQRSEAVRDLRTSYGLISLTNNGAYLFGGIESYNNIAYTSLIDSFHNVDVNCNGIDGDGKNIIGLNNKSIPLDLTYSCIIGESLLLAGDGVVSTASANLNNYLPQVAADTFYSNETTPVFLGVYHSEEPKQTAVLFKGLDEPDNIQFAYSVQLGNINYGHFTQKSGSSISQVDSDYYKVTVPSQGVLKTSIYNLVSNQVKFKFIDSATGLTKLYASNGIASGTFSDSVKKGTYYLNMFAVADTANFPYAFKFDFTPSALPIEFVSFNVNGTSESIIKASWSTANEINTDHFIIQHSIDGSSFTEIGSLKAIGKGANGYEFTDNSPANGINYYRLQGVDKDGSVNYSKVVSVNFSKIQSFSINPNPAKDFTTINFNKTIDNALIAVYDITGKALITQSLNGGTNSYKLNTQTLTNGIYVIKISTTTGSYNEKLLINK